MRSNFFSTNRAAELQRHNRSDSELKQQHEILLSTLLLEQQLRSTATNEHKRRANELNQLINYLDPRPEYIRVIIIEWLTKSSISIARTVSLDTERNLISVQRCKDLDGYSQQ
ncbi:unnamed protein product, partial [Rotaria magnacalcarata]